MTDSGTGMPGIAMCTIAHNKFKLCTASLIFGWQFWCRVAHIEETMDLAYPEMTLTQSLTVKQLRNLLLIVLVDEQKFEFKDFAIARLVWETIH